MLLDPLHLTGLIVSLLGLMLPSRRLKKAGGPLYDADIVDACLKLFREKRFQLEGT
jgi:hypothetical protein